MVQLYVKWGKESHSVDVDPELPGLVLKNQLYSLTGVPPERQKIMVKGGLLKDDSDLSKLNFKQGQKLIMMGTADKLPEAPTEAPIFMEDLPEEEQDHTGLAKYGLKNLGNTCYMNSTVQCLYRVPELCKSLAAYAPGAAADPAHKLTIATRQLFADLERSSQPVLPFTFLMQLRESYPQFAQQNNQGVYMQQDAEECWTQLLYSLRERLKDPSGEGAASDAVVHRLFGVGLHTRLVCEESGEAIEEDSTAYELKCNISLDVNHLSEGIRLGLQDDREKNSEALGRLALFKGSSAISRLPAYLNVQMVRFFYKVDVRQKAKILRKVVFPLVLDVYEFCTDAYKKKLDGPRTAWQAAEDERAGLEKAAKKPKSEDAAAAGGKAENGGGTKKPGAGASGADAEMKEAGEAAGTASAEGGQYAGQVTGRYELVAVLTHKGRSADSGHYVGWTRQDDGQWIQFDDEEMIPRKQDEVLALSGGGDWHMAYLLLYRAIRA